jgi:DNA replication licensing factor MCM4
MCVARCCSCRLAVFRCECCGAEASAVVSNGIIAVPPQCPSATCGRKQTLRIIPNRCAYANRQVWGIRWLSV